jgi:16S rRNA (cytosine967-C5)-methyltransferase
MVADARDTDTWWDGQLFDRILLDAPCSATGIIRRHPDIKWLRKQSDIEPLVAAQKQLLESVWTLLKPGGTLLYATCSILSEENRQQVTDFLQRTPEAKHDPIEFANEDSKIGWQILPGEQQMDGFYYARLIKSSSQ